MTPPAPPFLTLSWAERSDQNSRERSTRRCEAGNTADTDLAAQASRGNWAQARTLEQSDMAAPPERTSNRSGISEQEAREFHGYFTQMTTLFVGIALVAHLLMWMWRPWLGN